MKFKALLLISSLAIFTGLLSAQAQLLNELTEKSIDVKNCSTTVISVTVDKPCVKDCIRSVPAGESAEFKTNIGSSTNIHVTDASGTKFDYDTGILTNPVISRWFFWDGKALSPHKGKCKD